MFKKYGNAPIEDGMVFLDSKFKNEWDKEPESVRNACIHLLEKSIKSTKRQMDIEILLNAYNDLYKEVQKLKEIIEKNANTKN